jgi:hypothetical protein
MTNNTSSDNNDGTSNVKDQTTATPSTTDQSGSSTTPTNTPSETEDPSSSGDTTNTSSSAEHEKDHEDAADYVYDSSQVSNIELNGNSITTNSTTALIQYNTITILTAGTYKISGPLTEGQVIVNTQDKATVQLILSNVDITCSTSSPIYIMDAKKVIIILEDNTANTLTDKHTVNLADDPNAAIYSTCDLTIYGSGTLTVQANNNDGITSKDGLIIKSGIITVNSNDDGIRGKDYLIVKGGKITVTAADNGLLSDNADNSTKGYISVEGGTINIVAGGDAISAKTDVTITGGQITATTGGGSSSSTTNSAKAIKGLTSVLISSGTFTLNCADDAIHSNGTVTINGGTFSISTGDDAIHADSAVTITAGTIDITKSYEGIESVIITINGGTIYINSSDDGINGAGGNDASGMIPGPGRGGGGQDGFQNSGNCNLYINGGYIVVSASGDGVDVNGPITMTAGTLIINGPTSNFNGALDHVSFKMTGGLLVAVGSSGMAQAPSTTSTQYSIMVNFRNVYSAQTLIHIESSTGNSILTFKPTKQFQSIVFCSPALTKGSTYDIYVGGSSTGTLKDGIYSNGAYTAGTKYASLTITNIVTSFW